MVKTLEDMHKIVERILVTIRDPLPLTWILERQHLLPVEPRAGMEVRDHDNKYIFHIPQHLRLEKEAGEWFWLNEETVSQSPDRVEEYLRVMQQVHHYVIAKLPKVKSADVEKLEKALKRETFDVEAS